jgi:UDP-N-acetyl-D-glucosamine dehydrogenase
MSIKINTALNRHKKSINGSKILFLGVAYKADIDDERESPALHVIDEVCKKLGDVMYHDPHVPHIVTEEGVNSTVFRLLMNSLFCRLCCNNNKS